MHPRVGKLAWVEPLGEGFSTVGVVYAKSLIPGPNPVRALMATTDDADTLIPQLLDRGWALFAEPPPEGAAGRLIIGADRCIWSSTARRCSTT